MTLPLKILVDKQQFTPRMIDDVNGIVRTEILQDRHDDRAVGDRRQIDRDPIAVVLTHQRDLVILLDAAFLKQDMKFLDVNG